MITIYIILFSSGEYSNFVFTSSITDISIGVSFRFFCRDGEEREKPDRLTLAVYGCTLIKINGMSSEHSSNLDNEETCLQYGDEEYKNRIALLLAMVC